MDADEHQNHRESARSVPTAPDTKHVYEQARRVLVRHYTLHNGHEPTLSSPPSVTTSAASSLRLLLFEILASLSRELKSIPA